MNFSGVFNLRSLLLLYISKNFFRKKYSLHAYFSKNRALKYLNSFCEHLLASKILNTILVQKKDLFPKANRCLKLSNYNKTVQYKNSIFFTF